ncbi:RHS repeat domain-containing protein [Dysgonomonas sp. Marseille-P4677]|uniref:RHS repeat domain-containing protein n=1 Tax=Dysgonomonas sp. Marseille-P4677 TaxID=2364790 RepID=UPI001F22A366|nr:RHS repeat-associated core domain-containing protein [Dysgonomonas sp. Marseille-P4677]
MVINSSTVKAKNYYTYSASGVKLKTEQRYDPTLVNSPIGTTTPATDGFSEYKNTDYVGNIIYETSKSSAGTVNKTRILVDGGYIENGVYHYYLADHLGNNRVVVNASGTITQRNHYYPFGTAFAEKYDDGKKQQYKYNGKELDDMHQLNLYDYSARYYESAVGRFTSVDPMAEMYSSISPYAYVANNPIRRVDPTGMNPITIVASTFIDSSGKIIDVRNDGDNSIYLVHNLLNWDGSKNNLLVIGYTPEPDTFKNHIGKNLKSPEVVNFYFSELDRLKKNGIAFSWKGLQHLDILAKFKTNQDEYKKAALEYKELLKELIILNAKLHRSNSRNTAWQKAKTAELMIACKRILLRTGLFAIPNTSIPGDDYVEWFIPFDTSTIDATFNKELEKIDEQYQNIYNKALGL